MNEKETNLNMLPFYLQKMVFYCKNELKEKERVSMRVQSSHMSIRSMLDHSVPRNCEYVKSLTNSSWSSEQVAFLFFLGRECEPGEEERLKAS